MEEFIEYQLQDLKHSVQDSIKTGVWAKIPKDKENAICREDPKSIDFVFEVANFIVNKRGLIEEIFNHTYIKIVNDLKEQGYKLVDSKPYHAQPGNEKSTFYEKAISNNEIIVAEKKLNSVSFFLTKRGERGSSKIKILEV